MQSARRKLPRSKTSGINGLRHYSFRPRRETPHNRALRIIAEHAEHLKHRPSGWRAGIEALLMEIQIDALRV